MSLSIAILSRQLKPGSAVRLQEAFAKRGHDARVINTLKLTLMLASGKLDAYEGNKKLPEFDGVLARIGMGLTNHGVAALRQFELQGVTTIPHSDALIRSRQKLAALQHLAAGGVPVPATAYVHRSRDLEVAVERLGGAPLIVKVIEGTGGQGVILAESTRTAVAIAGALIKAGKPVLLQSFVAESSGRDNRVLIVGGRVVAAARRVAKEGEYRSNVHLGATATPMQPDEATSAVAIKAAQLLGLEIAGVDVLEGKDGPVVLEVNSSPGITGIEGVTGIDVAGAVVEHVEERLS